MSINYGIRAERLIAKRYEERGYIVTMDPPSEAIPFSLGNYRPDILATSATESLIIEVKGPRSDRRPDQYLELARVVASHPGWKFLLVTVSENELLDQEVSQPADNPSVDALRRHVQQLDQLSNIPDSWALIFLPLWSAYVTALSLLIVQETTLPESRSDAGLLSRAYFLGILSIEEYENAKRLMLLRNKSAHGIGVSITEDDWRLLRQLTRDLLNRLEPGKV